MTQRLMIALTLVTCLTACNTKYVYVDKPVYIPVKQDCVKSDVASKPSTCTPTDQTMFEKTKCLIRDRLAFEDWGESLNAIVAGCR